MDFYDYMRLNIDIISTGNDEKYDLRSLEVYGWIYMYI